MTVIMSSNANLPHLSEYSSAVLIKNFLMNCCLFFFPRDLGKRNNRKKVFENQNLTKILFCLAII